MKNSITVFLVLVFSATIFSSCKKAYKCSCENVDALGNSYKVENPYLKKMSKSQANEEKAKCEASAGCQFVRDK